MAGRWETADLYQACLIFHCDGRRPATSRRAVGVGVNHLVGMGLNTPLTVGREYTVYVNLGTRGKVSLGTRGKGIHIHYHFIFYDYRVFIHVTLYYCFLNH